MAEFIIAVHFDIDTTDIEAICEAIEQLSTVKRIKRIDLLNENDYVDNTKSITDIRATTHHQSHQMQIME